MRESSGCSNLLYRGAPPLSNRAAALLVSEAFIIDLQYPSGNKQGAPQAAPHEGGPRAEMQQATTPASSSSSSSTSKGGLPRSVQGSLDQRPRSSDSAGKGPHLRGAPSSVPAAASQQAGGSSSSAGGSQGEGPRLSPGHPERPCRGGSPPWDSPREEGGETVSFCSLLKSSLRKVVLRAAYCKGCGGNVECNVTVRAVSLPLYLMLHANAREPQDLGLWRSLDRNGRGFLRRRVWIKLTDQDVEVVETETPGFIRYDLMSSLFAVRPLKGPPGASGGPPGTDLPKALPVRSFAKATNAEKSAKHEKRDVGACHLVLQVRVPSAYVERPQEEEASSFASSKMSRGGPQAGAPQGGASTLSSTGASEAPWIAINDFVLSYVRPRAVLDFVSPWKWPCILCFAREDAESGEGPFIADFNAEAAGRQKTTEFVRDSGDRIVPIPRVAGCPVSVEAFLSEQNLSLCPDAPREPVTFKPLTPSELLLMQTIRLRREEQLRGLRGGGQKGATLPLPEALGSGVDAFFVAMDAEFVAEVTEAAEIDEEGHKHVLQSSSLALARSAVLSWLGFEHKSKGVGSRARRLTLVRGQGPLEGVPFMDHFVQFTRPPKDCLTRSRFYFDAHKLPCRCCSVLAAPRAAAAAAARFSRGVWQPLLPLLRHDFRVINLYVPSSQVVDTVELYRKYLEMKEQGTLAGCILRLYEMGYHTNWLAPPLGVSVASASAASAAQLLLLSSEEARAAAAAASNSNNQDPTPDEPALQDLLFPHR
ncbi:hypothetical protein Emag_004311 [Eimeria magna]